MAREELRVITEEERILMDPRGHEKVSRSGGHPDALLLGRVAFFGAAPSVETSEQGKGEIE